MALFRIFFKNYGDGPTDKSKAIIEIEKKNISEAIKASIKMGKKKDMRVVMVAEIGDRSAGIKDKL